LCDVPRSFRRSERRPSRVSSMVAALLLLLAASTPHSTAIYSIGSTSSAHDHPAIVAEAARVVVEFLSQ
jgi:hypothetical protein